MVLEWVVIILGLGILFCILVLLLKRQGPEGAPWKTAWKFFAGTGTARKGLEG